MRAVRVHHPNLRDAAAIANERDARAVGRPCGLRVLRRFRREARQLSIRERERVNVRKIGLARRERNMIAVGIKTRLPVVRVRVRQRFLIFPIRIAQDKIRRAVCRRDFKNEFRPVRRKRGPLYRFQIRRENIQRGIVQRARNQVPRIVLM